MTKKAIVDLRSFIKNYSDLHRKAGVRYILYSSNSFHYAYIKDNLITPEGFCEGFTDKDLAYIKHIEVHFHEGLITHSFYR